jgi:hypothetical protein
MQSNELVKLFLFSDEPRAKCISNLPSLFCINVDALTVSPQYLNNVKLMLEKEITKTVNSLIAHKMRKH